VSRRRVEFEGRATELPPEEAGRSAELALGVLAAIPLLLFYEASLGAAEGARRNVAQVLLGAVFEPFGEHAGAARVLAWCAVGVVAAVHCLRRRVALGPRLLRTVAEGALAALVLGPALVGSSGLFGDGAPDLPLVEWYPASAPPLAQVGFLAGGAAYEEFVFRLGAFSAVFLGARQALSFFGVPLAGARLLAEVVATIGSSLLFAAFHLQTFTHWLGWRGEPFDASLFFWRFLAGLLLCVLFRWRGLGVSCWAHALFNAGLVLGVGPAVLRGP
jgi:hypothetical protein